jgi:hypothetical protein
MARLKPETAVEGGEGLFVRQPSIGTGLRTLVAGENFHVFTVSTDAASKSGLSGPETLMSCATPWVPTTKPNVTEQRPGFPSGLERHPTLFGSEWCKGFSRVLGRFGSLHTRIAVSDL